MSLYLPESNDLSFLIGLPGLAAKWKPIGVHLGVPCGQLDAIQQDNHGCVNMSLTCLREMFLWWLRNGEEVTAKKLAEAVHKVDEHQAEVKINQNYRKRGLLLPASDHWEGVQYTYIVMSLASVQ